MMIVDVRCNQSKTQKALCTVMTFIGQKMSETFRNTETMKITCVFSMV